jgi:hypothetical protein
MPGLDRTGPAGMGPMTGGARGLCNPYGPLYGSYAPYRYPYPAPRAYPWAFGLGRPRWGMGRGYWGRGAFGLGFRGRGRRGGGRGRW